MVTYLGARYSEWRALVITLCELSLPLCITFSVYWIKIGGWKIAIICGRRYLNQMNPFITKSRKLIYRKWLSNNNQYINKTLELIYFFILNSFLHARF